MAASDVFLKLDGITGEAKDKVHGGEIDILSWSWHMAIGLNRGGGGPSKAPDVGQLILTKIIDRSSPQLMTALVRATKIKRGDLVCRKAGGSPLEFIKIRMTDVYIAAIRPGGTGGDGNFIEEVALDFAHVSVSYQEQDDKGGPKGGVVEFEYNLKSNA